jgi:hypothetical protein
MGNIQRKLICGQLVNGCILYELASGEVAFKEDWEVMNQRTALQISVPRLPDSLEHHLQGTINDLLHGDPLKRPTASIARAVFLFHSRLLDPSIIHIDELIYAPSYPECKLVAQTYSNRSDFLVNVANHFEQIGNNLPLGESRHGETTLHWAAARGTARSVQTLLNANADVTIRSRTNETALHWGARSGNSSVVK